MIGIIGYGVVGQAIEYGFDRVEKIISDPAHNQITIEDVCKATPDAIFVCVPTPTDDSDYQLLRSVLAEIKTYNTTSLVVVNSTILPQYIEEFDVVHNPEFLSRATSNQDFVNPPFILIGGEQAQAVKLLSIYQKFSSVDTSRVFITDIKTASMAKYIMNSFYATKLTFMNQMYDIAVGAGAEWNNIVPILEAQPWMGTHHFNVPGPDGSRGFGGPCLPKDTAALVKHYDVDLLKTVLELNERYRQ